MTERILCSDLSCTELVRFLSPLERRAYWHGRQIGWFRRRMRLFESVDASALCRTRSGEGAERQNAEMPTSSF